MLKVVHRERGAWEFYRNVFRNRICKVKYGA